MSRFASQQRHAHNVTKGSGAEQYVPVYLPPPPVPMSDVHTPSVDYAPIPERQPYVGPVAEQQWITGVPNIVTGLTGLAAAYALYLAVAK